MPTKPPVVEHPQCPECKGEAYVESCLPGRRKPCPRCGGRGWVRGPTPAASLRSDPVRRAEEAEKIVAAARENIANCRAAMRMIRDVVEAHAPPGSVAAEEDVEPPFTKEAEALVAGILAIAEGARRKR